MFSSWLTCPEVSAKTELETSSCNDEVAQACGFELQAKPTGIKSARNGANIVFVTGRMNRLVLHQFNDVRGHFVFVV